MYILRLLAGTALLVGTSTLAHAAPTASRPSGGTSSSTASKSSRAKHQPAPTKLELNGMLHLSERCSQRAVRTLEFFDRPRALCVKWIGKKPTAWAQWKLRRLPTPTHPGAEIGSGIIPAATLGTDRTNFGIPTGDLLPRRNRSKHDVTYVLQIESKLDAGSPKITRSASTTFVQRPISEKPKPSVVDPYRCSGPYERYTRNLYLYIPTMAVNAITSNDKSWGGDRDEMFIAFDSLGPGPDPKHGRLPGPNDYWEAKEGSVGSSEWQARWSDDSNPVIFSQALRHGAMVDLGISIQEQDNGDLDDLATALSLAMGNAVAAAAKSGPIASGIAGLIDGGLSLIPSNDGQDMLAYAGVRIENRCGHVRMTWYTLESASVPGGGTVLNQFQDMSSFGVFGTRSVVLSLPNSVVVPPGDSVDWGGYRRQGKADEFWWKAKGTSNSSYTYRVRAAISKPRG